MHRAPALIVLSACMLSAGEIPLAKPESVGMSSQRLERIGAWLREIINRKEAAGFVTLVARHGKVVHHQAHGTRGLTVTDAMPLDAIFDLASMTKPIMVTAAMMLLEEGRFTLREPITTYLPEFKDVKVESKPGVFEPLERPIQVRDLFTHTSGIHNPGNRLERYKSGTLEAYVQALAKRPLQKQPGSSWLYGDSHDVLGRLIEKAAGEPIDRFFQRRIFGPLEMQDTHYWPPSETQNRRAVLVVRGKDDIASSSRYTAEAARQRTFFQGQSGLYSTAADYWRFTQMLLSGGVSNGRRFLGPRTISWMTQNHIGDLANFPYPGLRFGLGMAVVVDPGATGSPYSKGTYYWDGSQGTLFWIDPQEDLIGILMVQLTPNPLRLREKFTALVYSSIEK